MQWAFKGHREHVVKMNTPNVAHPTQQIDIEFPALSKVMVPNTQGLTFNLDLGSSKDKTRTIVNNIGRALVTKKELLLGGTNIQLLNNSNVYDTHNDFYMTKDERKDALLQGIQGENGLKSRIGAKKTDGTELAINDEEKATSTTLNNKFYIPLDFDVFNQPIYPFGLHEKLVVRLTFNTAENVMKVTGDKDAKYNISNICLEFDKINNENYAEKMMQNYTNGYAIPYDKVSCIHYSGELRHDPCLFVLFSGCPAGNNVSVKLSTLSSDKATIMKCEIAL